MQKSKSKRKKAENIQASTFIKVQIFAFIFYIILFILFSFIGLITDLPQKYDYYFSLSIFTVSSFITGFYAGNKLLQNGLLVGILYSLPMNVITIIFSLIFSHFKVDIFLAITVTILIISSGIGGIFAVNRRRRR